jgi:hypothetical protein
MKDVMTNVLKAGLAMLAGWTLAGWMLFLLISSLTLISQS